MEKREIIKTYKDLKKVANIVLDENKKGKEFAKKRWELEIIENNILELKEIIKEINKNLHDKEIQKSLEYDSKFQKAKETGAHEDFFNAPLGKEMIKAIRSNFILFDIVKRSLRNSLLIDLNWIKDGSWGEHMKLALGELSPDYFERYLGSKRKRIEKEVLPYLKSDSKYVSTYEVFLSALSESKKKKFLTSNILLITGIESLVRLLSKYVYGKQNPELSEEEIDTYIYDKFQTLEGLIKKGEWKEDLHYTLREVLAMENYGVDESIKKAQRIKERHIEAQNELYELNKIILDKITKAQSGSETDNIIDNDLQKEILSISKKAKDIVDNGLVNYDQEIFGITIRTKLLFLLRRYKEDRNQLIHGKFEEFNKGWKNYIYWAALFEVYQTIKLYGDKYE